MRCLVVKAHPAWHEPPDFYRFIGDEDPTFDSRPSNELMYVRGVGNLRPEPRDSYGPYDVDVVDSVLICAVRSPYESLVRQLEYSFAVDVVDAFNFVTRNEVDQIDPSPYRISDPPHRPPHPSRCRQRQYRCPIALYSCVEVRIELPSHIYSGLSGTARFRRAMS